MKKLNLANNIILFKYLFLSGSLVALSFFCNLFFVVYINYNFNAVFIFSFFFFNILSYLLNSIYSFKNKPSFKKYFVFLQNTFFTWVLGIILVNALNKFYAPEKFLLVIVLTIFVSSLNLILNLTRTFEIKNFNN